MVYNYSYKDVNNVFNILKFTKRGLRTVGTLML